LKLKGCDDEVLGADGERGPSSVNFEHPVKRVRENDWVRQTPASPTPQNASVPPPVPPRGPRQHPGSA